MTDNGQQLPAGSEGQPTPADSTGNDKPSSETVAIPKSEWEAVQKTLQRLDNDTRSNKDRAVKRTNERMDELQTRVDRVFAVMEQFNISKEDAFQVVESQDAEAEKDKMIREMYQSFKGGTPNSASGNAPVGGGKVAEVVKEFGLDENDAEIVDVYKRYSSPDEQEKAVLRIAAKRSNQPSISAAPSMGGKPLQSVDVNQLAEEHSRLMKNPTENMKRLREIQEALNKAI